MSFAPSPGELGAIDNPNEYRPWPGSGGVPAIICHAVDGVVLVKIPVVLPMRACQAYTRLLGQRATAMSSKAKLVPLPRGGRPILWAHRFAHGPDTLLAWNSPCWK